MHAVACHIHFHVREHYGVIIATQGRQIVDGKFVVGLCCTSLQDYQYVLGVWEAFAAPNEAWRLRSGGTRRQCACAAAGRLGARSRDCNRLAILLLRLRLRWHGRLSGRLSLGFSAPKGWGG